MLVMQYLRVNDEMLYDTRSSKTEDILYWIKGILQNNQSFSYQYNNLHMSFIDVPFKNGIFSCTYCDTDSSFHTILDDDIICDKGNFVIMCKNIVSTNLKTQIMNSKEYNCLLIK